jgi:hypothetical protein
VKGRIQFRETFRQPFSGDREGVFLGFDIAKSRYFVDHSFADNNRGSGSGEGFGPWFGFLGGRLNDNRRLDRSGDKFAGGWRRFLSAETKCLACVSPPAFQPSAGFGLRLGAGVGYRRAGYSDFGQLFRFPPGFFRLRRVGSTRWRQALTTSGHS